MNSLIENKTFNIQEIRNDFPILTQSIKGKQLIYFDNAATTQKPNLVIDSINKYYKEENSNIHRGAHYLSEMATLSYEKSRRKVQNFINAQYEEEVIFTKGTTDSINLITTALERSKFFNDGDEIIISELEHHSNIVPWQILCELKNLKLKVIPINNNGELIIDEFENLLNERTKYVSINYVSNSLGTVNPIKEIIALSHSYEAKVIVDAAQAIQHKTIDVIDLDCDFLAFSGHKIYGPTGIGVLYGKKDLLETLPPYQGGGEMIKIVSFSGTTYNDLPFKYEAGTPNIAGGIGLGYAIDYLVELGLDNIDKYENTLHTYMYQELMKIDRLKFIGNAKDKLSVHSFLIDGLHPADIGTMLDANAIAIRTGHHCTQPVMERFDIRGTCRASIAFYNTKEEVDKFIHALNKAIKILS